MSVKLGKNPVPRTTWRTIKALLADYGVAVEEKPVVFLDDVGDEYCAFAVLYVKEKP
jgi:hypothetical protein